MASERMLNYLEKCAGLPSVLRRATDPFDRAVKMPSEAFGAYLAKHNQGAAIGKLVRGASGGKLDAYDAEELKNNLLAGHRNKHQDADPYDIWGALNAHTAAFKKRGLL